MPPKDPPTKSGITHLPTGDAIIPASTRPDGSVRKEIRVKPGYRPPEDVELYKNRTAEAWKNRGKGGGVPGAAKADVGPGEKGGAAGAAAANKNAKRREARKKAAGAATNGSDGVSTAPAEQANGSATSQAPAAAAAAPLVDAEAEAAKEARKLAKKLRQARELKEKQAAGAADGTVLLPEQLAKVMRVQELVRQLDALGFDGEGERKTGKSEGEGGAGTEGSGGEKGAKEEGEEEARAAG